MAIGVRPRSASTAGRYGRNRGRDLSEYPELMAELRSLPVPCEWSRANVDGCVKKPKLRSDEAKLKELFICCRAANWREVRAIGFHNPWLLAMTDDNGFTALHHAEMSGNAAFMTKLLDMYNDPRSFTSKFVRYGCEQDLLLDGLKLNGRSSLSTHTTPHTTPKSTPRAVPSSSRSSRNSASGEPVTVRQVAPTSIAAAAGVVPGDTLEIVEGAPLNGVHRVMLGPEDIAEVLLQGAHIEDSFPLVLEFHGPASAEILGRDSWTPLHAAAGGGEHYKKVCRVLRQEQSKLPGSAHDSHGCTPEHWRLMSKRSTEGVRRRPLSAGPCPQRWPSQETTRRVPSQRSMAQDGERIVMSNKRLPPRAPIPKAPAPAPPPIPAH